MIGVVVRAKSIKTYWGKSSISFLFASFLIAADCGYSWGAESFLNIPGVRIEGGGELAVPLKIAFILTILTLAPSILVMLTSFTRVVVVLSFLRQALGTQQMPPNQVIVGLSLFLTFFIMSPVWTEVKSKALDPLINKEIAQEKALGLAMEPVREFMFRQTSEKDLALFMKIAKLERPETAADIPTHVLIPSFIIGELKRAFQIGFLIYVPFIVLDMVVASVLLSMGMMMLPPVMISLPFKLMLFVLVDGWHLIVGSLVKSFV
jgi:flagellar biosynthetic protein FliP